MQFVIMANKSGSSIWMRDGGIIYRENCFENNYSQFNEAKLNEYLLLAEDNDFEHICADVKSLAEKMANLLRELLPLLPSLSEPVILCIPRGLRSLYGGAVEINAQVFVATLI